MLPPDTSVQKPRSRWRKWRLIIGNGLLIGCVGAVYYYYTLAADEKRLQAAFAAADQLDPGWRLDDLLSKQAMIPDEENGAWQRIAVKRLLPANWRSRPITNAFMKVRPEVQLDADLTAALRAKLKELSSAVEAARKLAYAPKGNEPLERGPDGIGSRFPPKMGALEVAHLLEWDAVLLVQDREFEKAATSCRAIIGAARTLGEGPTLMSVLVRNSMMHSAKYALKRILAQGELREAALADLQRLLEEEVEAPLWLHVLRSERASLDDRLEELQSRAILTSDMIQYSPNWRRQNGDALDELYNSMKAGSIKRNRAACLECYTRLVEIYKLPEKERIRQRQALVPLINGLPWLAQKVGPGTILSYLRESDKDNLSLRIHITALAAERFRLTHGRWPESCAVLVPQYLAKVPEDLYGDGPLRLRRDDHGLIVYSVGPDGIDNGGAIGMPAPTDVGIRLWDPKERRKLPAETKAP